MKTAKDSWDSPGWREAAHEYHELRGDRVSGDRFNSGTQVDNAERIAAELEKAIAEYTSRLRPTPWREPPSNIPPRQFLDLDRHYSRGEVGATIAAGGRGKTTRACYEAISFAVGRDLATGQALPCGPLRVWYLNGEERQDELDRRLAATCQHYGISHADIDGRLFIDSVRAKPLRMATMAKGGVAELNRPLITALGNVMENEDIDVLLVDPLVSFHSISENDNMAMDLVVKEGFGAIAERTNSACELFHHPGKPKAGAPETVVEDARGASALIWAARSARVFNFMTTAEAADLGISEDDRRTYVRIANGKANMGAQGKAKWMRLVLENLPNGDVVACGSSWTPPNPFDGVSAADVAAAQRLTQTAAYRADSRSPQWFGYAIAKHLGLPVFHEADNDKKDMAKVKAIIKTWLKNKVLDTEEGDGRGRHKVQYIVAGPNKPAGLNGHQHDDDVLE